MKLKRTKIKIPTCKFSVKQYIMLTMYATPFIDLLNGFIGDKFPVGKICRTMIILMNLLFCIKYTTFTSKKVACISYCIMIYMIVHVLVADMISTTNNFTRSINFTMKLMLFVSELLLIILAIERNIINKRNIEKFWKFSCWFVPVSLLIAKVFNYSNAVFSSKAGLYASVNAMSIIFIVQFILCIMYAEKQKKYWMAVLMNMLVLALLGTKSPYLYIVLILVLLMLFYSKHRAKTIGVVALCGAFAYCVLKRYFLDKMIEIYKYQSYYLLYQLQHKAIWGYLLSGRNVMVKRIWDMLVTKNLIPVTFLFGIGAGNLVSGAEMDMIEILFSYGIGVTVGIYYLVLRSFGWHCVEKNRNLFFNVAIFCLVTFGFLGGHTFTEAIAATYSAILIGYKYSFKYEDYLRGKSDEQNDSVYYNLQ